MALAHLTGKTKIRLLFELNERARRLEQIIAANQQAAVLFTQQTAARLARIEGLLAGIQKQELIEMKALDDLTAEVQRNTDVEASAVTLINGIAAQLKAAGTDPVALQALQDKLSTSADSLAAAVAANTAPVQPPAVP